MHLNIERTATPAIAIHPRLNSFAYFHSLRRCSRSQLIFVQILIWNIILWQFPGVHFSLVLIVSFLYSGNCT